MTHNLKSRIGTGDLLVGTFVKTPSALICEVLGRTALDVLCLDAEHAPFDRLPLDQCLHALRGAGMPAVVRVPSAAPEHTQTALDSGASGVVIPHVISAQMAHDAVAAAHFGTGGRGYAGSTRAAGFTSTPLPQHLRESAASTVVIAQIEDVEALDCIDQIAAVAGIDCLFIGRIDLTVALGVSSPTDPEVVAAVERICASAVRAGRPVGMFVSDLSEIPRWRKQGASLFLLSSDHSFLLQGANDLAQRVTSLVSSPAAD